MDHPRKDVPLPDLHTAVPVESTGEEKQIAHDQDEEHEEHEESRQASLDGKSAGRFRSPSITNHGENPDEKHMASEDPESGRIDLQQTSTRTPSVIEVPMASRSGLFARFSLVYEAQEPKHYPRNIKWLITFWISIAAMVAPMGSSIILPALTDISMDFGATPTITNLSVALYMLAMAIFPLWWSSFSETGGRRTVYVISFTLFVVFNIIAALSSSIGMFIVFRLLSGGTSAAVQAVGAGTIADIWDVHERGRAMGIFYLGPLCGPLLSPVIGGALSQGLGWRSTQWFQVIFGGVVVIGIILCLPETHIHSAIAVHSRTTSFTSSTHQSVRPTLTRTSTRQSVALKTKKYASLAHRIFIEPLTITKYLQFPAVALTITYASIAFGSLYFLNISVERTFSRAPYDFSTIIVGCLYMFNSAGYFLASLLGGPWVDHIMAREARTAGRIDARGKLLFRPEDRMRENVWVAAFLMPAALLWYGWTAEYGIYFLAPMAANFVFGIGSMLLFGAATTMLTEMMPGRASNGVALNNCVRNIVAFIGTFLSEPLIKAIGNGWLFTILGIISGLAAVIIPIMRRCGERWRERMDIKMKDMD
ncbi:hypothetical protein FH972_022495 [Carpinus fangiana]|uniref:Major facilitator superfamily (MFS) profile domain-containing protein n=1 Tax=Carpinus fangiana TaxID=176857 RepID=A0A5N6KSE8_9ROSI|nr:hypothetical protein FH972_022495 [Carpinus fangiana]